MLFLPLSISDQKIFLSKITSRLRTHVYFTDKIGIPLHWIIYTQNILAQLKKCLFTSTSSLLLALFTASTLYPFFLFLTLYDFIAHFLKTLQDFILPFFRYASFFSFWLIVDNSQKSFFNYLFPDLSQLLSLFLLIDVYFP